MGSGRKGTALAIAGLFFAAPSLAAPVSVSPEQAYDLGDVPSGRATGMGGALNALGVSTPALYLNPANMSLARVYHLEALGALSPEAKGEMVGAAIVDSALNSNRLAGGLSLDWAQFDPDGLHRTWTDARGALSMPVGDHLSFGATDADGSASAKTPPLVRSGRASLSGEDGHASRCSMR